MSLLSLLRRRPRELEWGTQRFDLGSHELRLELPLRESRDYPPSEPPERVSLHQPVPFDSDGWFTVVRTFYDDPTASRLSIVGSLSFQISLCEVETGETEDVLRPDGLARHLERRNREYLQRLARAYAAKGDPPPATQAPERYHRTAIAGIEWVLYRYADRHDSAIYATPLHSGAFLALHFNLIGSWKADAAVIKARIMSSCVLTARR